MNNKKVVSIVEELTIPLVKDLNLELVDVEYKKEAGRFILRIFIDKAGGVTLDDCQALSERLDTILDEADPIPHSYFLEVSSPGIERPLKKAKDFQRFQGRLAKFKTFEPLNGRKKFTGRLVDASGEVVVVDIDGNSVTVPLDKIASARLVAEFYKGGLGK